MDFSRNNIFYKVYEHVALTGTNGSGSSLLAKLLVGMYELDTGQLR